MSQPDILTVEEVAALLKVSERTIYDWAQKKTIPCGKIGSTWRFKRSEIDKWLDAKIGGNVFGGKGSWSGTLLEPDQILLMDHSLKIDALNELSFSLAKALGLANPYDLATNILKREELMSTGIGREIAVPHVRLPDVNTIKMAVGVNARPIMDYESMDGKGVKLLFMIVAGKGQHAEYLKLLAKISSHLKNDDLKNEVINSQNKTVIYNLMTNILG